MNSGLTVSVRAATQEDAVTLAALNHHVHDLHVAAEGNLYAPTDDQQVARWFAERLAQSSWHALLAVREDEAVGYVVVRCLDTAASPFSHPRREALVDQLVVAPSARRHGVGRALMEAAEAHARTLGLGSLVLDVRPHNHGAEAFYASLGFDVLSTRLSKPL